MRCLKDIGGGLLIALAVIAALAVVGGVMFSLEWFWRLWLTNRNAIQFATFGSFFMLVGAIGGAVNCYLRDHK